MSRPRSCTSVNTELIVVISSIVLIFCARNAHSFAASSSSSSSLSSSYVVLPPPVNYSFCAVLYAPAGSSNGAWSVSYSGWFQTAPLPTIAGAAIPVYQITNVSTVRTYIASGAAAVSTAVALNQVAANTSNLNFLYARQLGAAAQQ